MMVTHPTFEVVPREKRDKRELTDREREVLALVANGCRDIDVANALHIEYMTAKNHMTHINTKLGTQSRLAAVLTALDAGVIRREGELHD